MGNRGPQRAWQIYTQPQEEPISLAEAKAHLKVEAGSLEENISVSQVIAPGEHAIAAAYSLKGTAIDVSLAGEVVAVLDVGNCGSPAGTIDAKLQESDTNLEADFTDVPDGAFTQVTGGNDNQAFTLAYTGTCKYLRGVAQIAGAACQFGLSLIQHTPKSDEDQAITRYIKTARRWCEKYHGFAYVTQTWDLYLEHFPACDHIDLPRPPLQSVTHVKYKDSNDGTLTTLATTEYLVDTMSEPGRICLKSGKVWPATYPEAQAVQIRFVAGYGAATAVPDEVKDAILRKVADLYANKGDDQTSPSVEAAVKDLLFQDRLIKI